MTYARVSIQTEDFDLSHEIAELRRNDKGVGAVCSFVGTVRDRNEGDAVASMELEHYPGMTEKSIEAMVQEAFRRFDIFGARVIHRVGLLQPLDQIVLVAVTSAHPLVLAAQGGDFNGQVKVLGLDGNTGQGHGNGSQRGV